MTNHEIIRSALKIRKEILGKKGTMFDIGEVNHMMNMLRDEYEREKMQGVEVYISWSDVHAYSQPEISVSKPTEIDGLGGNAYSNYNVADACTCPDLIAKLLNISPGQCKKFRITEDLP